MRSQCCLLLLSRVTAHTSTCSHYVGKKSQKAGHNVRVEMQPVNNKSVGLSLLHF